MLYYIIINTDMRCLTPESLIIQPPQIKNSTSIEVLWAVQWDCPHTYSRPPVVYTIFIESPDGPVDEYYNKVNLIIIII